MREIRRVLHSLSKEPIPYRFSLCVACLALPNISLKLLVINAKDSYSNSKSKNIINLKNKRSANNKEDSVDTNELNIYLTRFEAPTITAN